MSKTVLFQSTILIPFSMCMAAGKSQLLQRIANNRFVPNMKTTIQVEFACRTYIHDGSRIDFRLYDTGDVLITLSISAYASFSPL